MYSNEAEKGNKHIYDDFKWKNNNLFSTVYTKILQRCKGWGCDDHKGTTPVTPFNR